MVGFFLGGLVMGIVIRAALMGAFYHFLGRPAHLR